jgi:CBS domain-containing membrane protein
VISDSHQLLGFNYVVYPVLINVIIMLALTLLVNRYVLRSAYPVPSPPAHDTVHKHQDRSPLARLGIHTEDLRAVLLEHNAYLDVSEAELFTLYNMAQMRAYTRKFGEVSVNDIMSRDVTYVHPDTSLEDAWALLRYHKVKVLPVIDEQRHVIGVVSLIDYLKRAKLKQYHDMAERLEELIKPRHEEAGMARIVADIMASPVFTVDQSELIATLVPLLSDKGLHHIPVVDDQQQLVGIVTQSDLIAALYSAGMAGSNPLPTPHETIQ